MGTHSSANTGRCNPANANRIPARPKMDSSFHRRTLPERSLSVATGVRRFFSDIRMVSRWPAICNLNALGMVCRGNCISGFSFRLLTVLLLELGDKPTSRVLHRYAPRQLRKRPWFTTITLPTVAIGIGANTTMSSLADLIIRKPLALPEMDRLGTVEEQRPGSEDTKISPANSLDVRSKLKTFDEPDAAVGAKLKRDGKLYTVIGIMPARATFPPQHHYSGCL